MSYLVCEQCGKYYELNEGMASFSYDKCECGGRLKYTSNSNSIESPKTTDNPNKIVTNNPSNICQNCGIENLQDSVVCKNCGKPLINRDENINEGISWVGIGIGFGFLLLSTLLTVYAIFGSNIPLKASDIPYTFLVEFGIIAMVISIISGLISAYVGGSIKFKYGIINGGLVGIILGILVGATSGSIAFLGVIAVFGSLSTIGGIIGTIIKRRR
jgi:hypothetical protein